MQQQREVFCRNRAVALRDSNSVSLSRNATDVAPRESQLAGKSYFSLSSSLQKECSLNNWNVHSSARMFTQQLERSLISKNVHSTVGTFTRQQECSLNSWNVHSSARKFTQQLERSLISKNVHLTVEMFTHKQEHSLKVCVGKK
ncbi:hypothetical protein Hdeb2414_s0005g00178011 [Helianthus debilis subsp. tardiflorus]